MCVCVCALMDGWIQMNELVVVLRDEEEDQGEKERERERGKGGGTRCVQTE